MGKKKAARKKSAKRAIKKSSVKPTAKKRATAKVTKTTRAFDIAAASLCDKIGSRPSDVLPGRFPVYAYRIDKASIADQLENLTGLTELEGFLTVEGYYRSPAIFLLAAKDQFRFFFADRKISKWIREKGEELNLQLTGIQIGKFFYTPKSELGSDAVRQLRKESKDAFGLDNPISVSSHRVTVRYG